MASNIDSPSDHQDIFPVTIEDEMKRSYLDYAMSVIVSRALPDVRDGLKPVHRRILYAMKESGYDWNRAYRKSARVVGDVMGQYHPHGDSAIYDAMVRMAQDFSMRLPLIDGQGNFGSMDGDPPAAMRYTEARLQRVASEALLEDIDRDTVDFQDNYDESTKEPTVLPARYPNLLVNGAGGIAVGMATNIPPHNLGEVLDGCCAYVDDPEISIDELNQIITGPDFPTGGIILGRTTIRDAYHTGRGSIVMRGRAEIQEVRKDKMAVVVTEVPYQVNKARMLEKIAEIVRDKTIDGITDIRDESDRQGVRVVIELRRDVEPEVVLNQLYRFSPLQTSFGANMLALNSGRPELLDLKSIISAFVAFREEVITRRTIYELGKARDRAHVLVGLAIAVANIDEIIRLIRAASDPVIAREQLMEKAWPARDVETLIKLIDEPGRSVDENGNYYLSEVQARAILELRLQRLTGLERDKIAGELGEIAAQIRYYLEILASREKLMGILREELVEMKTKYATPRRTEILDGVFGYDDEDLIQREEMVVTVSHGGYIKRVPLSTYRAQRRGGKGRSGMATRDEDFVSQIFVCNTHTPVLFFSSFGMVYKMKVYRLPPGTPTSRGKALINLLPLKEGETISTMMPLPEDEETWSDMYVMFATSTGGIRRNKLSDFTHVMSNGKIAMKLEDDSHLIGVRTCTEHEDIMLATARGKCIRFAVSAVRVFSGRTSTGVRGISLAEGDKVISMAIINHMDADSETRDQYMRYASAKRRSDNADEGDFDPTALETSLSQEVLDAMEADEQFILSISQDGLGKRSSSYEYRVTSRGGKGIGNLDLSRAGDRTTEVIGVFPIDQTDHIMLVTDAGKLIRCPVHDVRIAGRSTRGVKLFDVASDEKIVSVSRLADDGEEDEVESETDLTAEGENGTESLETAGDRPEQE
ncbi:DNA gyrase subunit A [Kiloniella laminariae]|uniref:DNA gyrase subunit A n=1 Tax=Kiloniella laminariae TaxID=454162 RepID=A0ABT4LN88_9PROT|nr:DNA gyrase subunit A [Kiloniella laminariae]MCZ4282610.1 DNA gyrase subunit A [Kiloniella laminariae]